MLSGPDRFVETAVLFAVMNGDEDRVRELIEELYPGELYTFEHRLDRALQLVHEMQERTR